MRVRFATALTVLFALVLAPILVPVTATPSATAASVRAATGDAGCTTTSPSTELCTVYAYIPADTEGTRDPVTGFTPPPPVCVERSAAGVNDVIPCEYQGGWWSNSRQCYVKYGAVQGAPLISPDAAGAWYDCMDAGSAGMGCWREVREAGLCEELRFRERFFSVTSPPGIRVMAPGQAAAIFAATFPLNAITIGLAPDPGVANSRTYVGVPVWMWAENPTPDTFGPYTESGTVGGLNITATATVTSLLWTMGDGSTVACATGGTPYDPGLGFTDSPNCGHRYSHTSAGQPGGRFPITATSQWDIVWAVGEAGGTINVTTVAESSVEVRELQSVNVGN
jgi:hypothetical protein